MKDYSQYGEQAAILQRFLGREYDPGGRFLDIGAWNAKTFSNTRALYELGWSGVLIEPSPGPMLGLLEAYGSDDRITLIQAAVDTTDGMIRMSVTDDAVSTSEPAEYEKWKGTAKFRGSVMVPKITLETIANSYGGFDFVSIDAEGISSRIFLYMLRLGHFPPCVCVEHEDRTTELLAAATAQGYKAVLVNSTNLVMVRG